MSQFHGAFDVDAFEWSGVEAQEYKLGGDESRGMGWKGVTRRTLGRADALPASFEVRYFELEPGGYSSLERHQHAHFVVALRGIGRALVGSEIVELSPFDTVHVPPMTPHRWINAHDGHDPFGFLCTVDRERDRPQPLLDSEWEALRADPATAPYVF